jgi:aspartate dehydrogenase
MTVKRTVGVIGAGRIGAAVIAHLKDTPGLRLGRVLTRSGLPDTADLDMFLSERPDLIIEAAGPEALRQFGPRCLRVADVWSVGAAALAEPRFLNSVQYVAQQAGTKLRLFAPWTYGIDTAPRSAVQSLRLTIMHEGVTPWSGSLREAARLFPSEVNFAVAAALNGPGIDRTELSFVAPCEPRLHGIDTICETEAGRITASIRFSRAGRHPTALSLIAALENLVSPLN